MDPAALLARVLDEPHVARVTGVLDIYGRAAGGLLANGLAFSALFAAIPTMLLVLGLTGLIASDPAIRDQVVDALIKTFPPLEELIEGAVDALASGAALTSIIGTLGVIWTVSQFYGALDVAFARIFAGVPERDLVGRTARGFVLVVILGALIVALIIVVSVMATLDALAPEQAPAVSVIADLVSSVWFLMAVSVVAVLLIYRTLPPQVPRWRSALIPAVVVGVAVVVLSQVFMFLVPRLVGVAALAGSIASAFIILAWLSFSFQALLYGAAWVRVRDDGVSAAASAGLGSPAATAEPGGGGE